MFLSILHYDAMCAEETLNANRVAHPRVIYSYTRVHTHILYKCIMQSA